ncbi:sulfatase-like hydrolase/transferase [Sphingobium scionense]
MNRLALGTAALALWTAPVAAQSDVRTTQTPTAPPNILIIYPDDVGWSNVSAYGQGVMGYTTPNIDRLAKEGAMFTEHYAQPSSTTGRASLITGQYPIRNDVGRASRVAARIAGRVA